MNNEFKKIAKQLGIAIPACLLSIGVANAETVKNNEVSKNINAAVSEISKNSLVNNEVVKFLTSDFSKNDDRMTPDHSDFHTNQGGNHADHHANQSHSDYHSNIDAKNNPRTQTCTPHSNNHTNTNGYSQHTNSGNKKHTDYHTDRNINPNC